MQLSNSFLKIFRTECISGSAIAPDLYEAAIAHLEDIEINPVTKEAIAFPIDEALNRKAVRFGYHARPDRTAAAFINEDGSIWQVKLSDPIFDHRKGKHRKYETPTGNGSRAFLPPVPQEFRQAIATRYGLELPLDGPIWPWVEAHPEIPVAITEGGKKTLSLLSQGYLAIGLYGVNGGYNCVGDARQLIPDLQRFAHSDRLITLAFDADEKQRTRHRVQVALQRFGLLLQDADCLVKIATWQPEQGKGIDDLRVRSGDDAVAQAIREAFPLADWKITQHLLSRLTRRPALRGNLPDLSQLDPRRVPESGVIGVSSAKGTGKSKLVGALVETCDKVIGGSHRVCLIRNLCQRWGLHYRGDLDKVGGQFITGDAYTLRVGGCVDSLMAFNPETFHGCDLILDEVVQVLRHLLTSSTCRKDGKLPALLVRLEQLVQAARRVIVLDADLDDAVLEYLEALRADGKRTFLIRNDYTPTGYPVELIECKNSSALEQRFIDALEHGQNIFVASDNKRKTKQLAELARRTGIEPLLINSETSGGKQEQDFISNPNTEALTYQVVIASPSVATGVSIEVEHFDLVFGLFTGAGGNDADYAQALGRVRPHIPRVVWCAKTGRRRGIQVRNRLQLIDCYQQRKKGVEQVLSQDLNFDTKQALQAINFADPHTRLWAHIQIEHNRAVADLANSTRVRLGLEGNHVTVSQMDPSREMEHLQKEIRAEQKQADATAVVSARILDSIEAALLEREESVIPEDRLALQRFHLCKFYAIAPETLSIDLVLEDREGRYRLELLRLENHLYPSLARDRDLQALNQQMRWGRGLVPWLLPTAELERKVLDQLGLTDFLDPDREWTAVCLAETSDRIRQHAEAIKAAFGYNVNPHLTDTQLVHDLLYRVGLKTEFRWCNHYPGQEGRKIRVYRLDRKRWSSSQGILERRSQTRVTGSPAGLNTSIPRGDLPKNPQESAFERSWVIHQGWWYWCDRIENGEAILQEMQGATDQIEIRAPLAQIEAENRDKIPA